MIISSHQQTNTVINSDENLTESFSHLSKLFIPQFVCIKIEFVTAFTLCFQKTTDPFLKMSVFEKPCPFLKAMSVFERTCPFLQILKIFCPVLEFFPIKSHLTRQQKEERSLPLLTLISKRGCLHYDTHIIECYVWCI